MRVTMIALAGATIVGASAQAAPTHRQVNERALAEARPAGEAKDCIQLTSIRETRVRSDNVIDFIMQGGKVFRNTLPHSCPQLGFEERILYKTSLSRLCSVDTVTVLQSPGITRGATCGLGPFQPIELPKP